MKTHDIKIQKEYFDLILSVEKEYELRKNDRDYKIGDIVILREIGSKEVETGRYFITEIAHVLKEFEGLIAGYCIFTFIIIETHIPPNTCQKK